MTALESFLFLALLCLGSDGREAKPEDHLSNQIRRIRTIVDELQRRLGDTTRVLVSVDRGNDRLVSVHPSETDQGT